LCKNLWKSPNTLGLEDVRTCQMGLYDPLDSVTNLRCKLFYFSTIIKKYFSKRKALAFNRDRCCYLVNCLRLILFHFRANWLQSLKLYQCKKLVINIESLLGRNHRNLWLLISRGPVLEVVEKTFQANAQPWCKIDL
jgi:hypothetical protein